MRESYKIALQWIQKGDNDLKTAKILLGAENPPLDNLGFHYQQAVEKYLKAFLADSEMKIPRIHDLNELCELCTQIDPSIELDIDYLTNLSEYAVEIRYSFDPKIDESALYSAYNYVQVVREIILSKLKKD